MGQISLPVINRTGLSIHWASSGANTFNSPNSHIKDFYIRNLISLVYRSYIPFFTLFKLNSKLTPGMYLFDYDTSNHKSYNRTLDNSFNIYDISASYNLKVPNYLDRYSNKLEELMDKALPIYNGNTLILKNNNVIIIVVKYFLVIRSNWYKQIRSYEYLLKSKLNNAKNGVYKKKIKRYRKLKNLSNKSTKSNIIL